jgi:twitching motility protein PilT
LNQAARDQIDTLLRRAVAEGASDLHLRCGQPPILRCNGRMQRPPTHQRSSSPPEAMIGVTMSEPTRADFGITHDVDFAYDLSLGDRFRVNAPRPQRPRCRLPSHSAARRHCRQLTRPVDPGIVRARKGLVPDGSGPVRKSTTLCAMVDLINQTHRSHHHDRRPHRISA